MIILTKWQDMRKDSSRNVINTYPLGSVFVDGWMLYDLWRMATLRPVVSMKGRNIDGRFYPYFGQQIEVEYLDETSMKQMALEWDKAIVRRYLEECRNRSKFLVNIGS